MDARREKRYRVRAAVKFTWQVVGGDPIIGMGHARDISSVGIFVVTDHPVAVGTWIHLDVALPGLRNREGARLKTAGCVIRTEANGFAVAAQAKFGLRFHGEHTQRNEQVLPGVEPDDEGPAAVPVEPDQAGTARFARFERN